MLTWKHYLRPYNTIRRLRLLAEARETINGLLQETVELSEQLSASQSALIGSLEARIKSLEKDLDLAKLATVSTVDPITRDSVLDTPEPKKYVN